MTFLIGISLVFSIVSLVFSLCSFSSLNVERNSFLISELIQENKELREKIKKIENKVLSFEDDGR